MNKIGLLPIFLIFNGIINGQEVKILKTQLKLDLGLQGVGLSFEPRISNKLTVDFCAGVGGGYDVDDENLAYHLLTPAYYISLTPKFFYNIKKRISKSKNTTLNSGNYIGIRFKSVNTFVPQADLPDAISDHVSLLNIHWGIQRTIGGHWLFNSQVGVGYAQDIDCGCGTFYPALDIKLSYILVR